MPDDHLDDMFTKVLAHSADELSENLLFAMEVSLEVDEHARSVCLVDKEDFTFFYNWHALQSNPVDYLCWQTQEHKSYVTLLEKEVGVCRDFLSTALETERIWKEETQESTPGELLYQILDMRAKGMKFSLNGVHSLHRQLEDRIVNDMMYVAGIRPLRDVFLYGQEFLQDACVSGVLPEQLHEKAGALVAAQKDIALTLERLQQTNINLISSAARVHAELYPAKKIDTWAILGRLNPN